MHASSVFIPHIIGVKSTMPDNQTETIPETISSKVNRAKPLPYVNKGVHFGRVKIESKIIRDSFEDTYSSLGPPFRPGPPGFTPLAQFGNLV